MMQSLTIKELLARIGKAATNNKKQLEENNAKTTKGKRNVDINFSKTTLKMAELIMQSYTTTLMNTANLLRHIQICYWSVCVCMFISFHRKGFS